MGGGEAAVMIYARVCMGGGEAAVTVYARVCIGGGEAAVIVYAHPWWRGRRHGLRTRACV